MKNKKKPTACLALGTFYEPHEFTHLTYTNINTWDYVFRYCTPAR